MSRARSRPPNHSRAWVDAVVCPIAVDAARVRAALPAGAGLDLRPLPGVRAGHHPIIVEIWRVHDGALETAGLDAHDWSELTATAAGFGVGGGGGALAGAGVGGVAGAAGGGALGMLLGPFGLAWGAAIGAAAGATTAAALGATAGAMWGARWAGGAARRASLVGSRILGSYSEILTTIPCVRGREDVAFVAAMYTDSVLSRVGERALGFGYRKRPARISHHQDDGKGHVTVHNRSGERLLEASFSRRAAPSTDASLLQSTLGRPLIGARARGQLALSFLDRAFDAPTAKLTRADVMLMISPEFLGGLLAGQHHLTAAAGRAPWGALMTTGVPVHLSYPRPLGP